MSRERYVTIAEVKEILTAESERRTRLMGIQPAVEYQPAEGEPVEEQTAFNQVQKDAMAHAEATSRIDREDANRLVEDLEGLTFGDNNIAVAMKGDAIAFKIADILPKYPEDVRAIFSKERVKLEADDITKIIDAVNKYL